MLNDLLPEGAQLARLLPVAEIDTAWGFAFIIAVVLILLVGFVFAMAKYSLANERLGNESGLLKSLGSDRVWWDQSSLQALLEPDSRIAETLIYRVLVEVQQTLSSTNRPVVDLSVLDSVEDELVAWVLWPRIFGNLAVFVGLLGTLGGLTVTVWQLKDAVSSSTANSLDMDAIVGQLSALIKAFNGVFEYTGYAFLSSAAGIVTSVLTLVCLNVYGRKSSDFLSSLRNCLVTSAEPAIERLVHVPSGAEAAERLQGAADTLAKALPRSIQNLAGVTADIATAGENLAKTTGENTESAKLLNTAVDAMNGRLSALDDRVNKLSEQAAAVKVLQEGLAESSTRVVNLAQEYLTKVDDVTRESTGKLTDIMMLQQQHMKDNRELLDSTREREGQALDRIAEVLVEQQKYVAAVADALRMMPPVTATQRALDEDRQRFNQMLSEFDRMIRQMEDRGGSGSRWRSKRQDPLEPAPAPTYSAAQSDGSTGPAYPSDDRPDWATQTKESPFSHQPNFNPRPAAPPPSRLVEAPTLLEKISDFFRSVKDRLFGGR